MANGIRAKDLKAFVQRQCDQHDASNWKGSISDYEADVMAAQSFHQNNNQSGESTDEAKLWKASDLRACMQCSKAHEYLQSNSLCNYTDDAIVQQMMWKHPVRKEPITPFNEAEL